MILKLTTICYIKKDNKTLMLHRVKRKNDVHYGKWVGLGGKMEQGETPEECIIREVKEESRLTIDKPLLRGILTFPKFKDGEDWYMFLFTADEFKGEIVEGDEGTLEWVNDSEVLNLNLWEGDKLFLRWMEEGKFFSGKHVYENGELVESSVVFY